VILGSEKGQKAERSASTTQERIDMTSLQNNHDESGEIHRLKHAHVLTRGHFIQMLPPWFGFTTAPPRKRKRLASLPHRPTNLASQERVAHAMQLDGAASSVN